MAFGSILLSILGISLLIFVHEAGHFLAARAAGVRVEVFSLGFGSRLCGFVWRGTDFRLSAVPFGGFVMVAGQDPSDRRYPARESLYAKSPGQRALFWSGGVLMNLLFAVIVFPLVFHAGVPFTAPVVGGVTVGGAAWEAGIESGERIVAVAGHEVVSFENLRMQVALSGQRPARVVVQKPDGVERTVTVAPQWNAKDAIYDLGVHESVRPEAPRLSIEAAGAAALAGLENDDELLAIQGVATTGPAAADAFLPLSEPTARPLQLRVRRGEREFDVELTPRVAAEPAPALLGIRSLPRQVIGLKQGEAMLARLGLRHGDVLLAVDGRAFVSGSLDDAVRGPAELRLTVLRDGQAVALETTASAAERQSLPDIVALGTDESLLLRPMPDGAAAAAGLLAGDRVVAIDDQTVQSFEGLREAVQAAGERPMKLRLQRLRDRSAPPSLDPTSNDLLLADEVELTIAPRRPYSLGMLTQHELLSEIVRGDSIADSVSLGVTCSINMVKQIYLTLKRLATGEVGTKNLGGIIRISTVSYQAAQRGMAWFWYFLGLLSVNLAIVNLLPIPVLDGGHLLFVLIEKVKGSPVSARVHGYSQVVGLVFVLMLVLFVTYNDILWLL